MPPGAIPGNDPFGMPTLIMPPPDRGFTPLPGQNGFTVRPPPPGGGAPLPQELLDLLRMIQQPLGPQPLPVQGQQMNPFQQINRLQGRQQREQQKQQRQQQQQLQRQGPQIPPMTLGTTQAPQGLFGPTQSPFLNQAPQRFLGPTQTPEPRLRPARGFNPFP